MTANSATSELPWRTQFRKEWGENLLLTLPIIPVQFVPVNIPRKVHGSAKNERKSDA